MTRKLALDRNAAHGAGGDCFSAAMRCLAALGEAGHAAGHQLVHGFVTRNAVDGATVHAWVERESDDRVIDTSNGHVIEIPRAKYYEDYGVQGVVRYSLAEADWKHSMSRHDGPWEPAFENNGR